MKVHKLKAFLSDSEGWKASALFVAAVFDLAAKATLSYVVWKVAFAIYGGLLVQP